MVVPNWLLRETFMVEHNPNCPSPFLVRLVGKGKGYIRRNSDDVRGYGQTLEDAATMAMKLAGKFTAVETSAVPSIREFIQETRKSCLHGGSEHCTFFSPGHPCCDCGAIYGDQK